MMVGDAWSFIKGKFSTKNKLVSRPGSFIDQTEENGPDFNDQKKKTKQISLS